MAASAASGVVSENGAGRTVVFEPGRTEVVLADGAPGAAAFAASEATNFLSRVLGTAVPVVSRPTGKGVASLVLGSNAWSVAAGAVPEGSARDGFRIRAVGDGVYIVGNDDDVDVPALMRRGAHNARFRSGTLFGVYEFLERFAGVRFYFPGEMGTVVPRTRRIAARARSRSAYRVAPVFSLHIRRKMPRRAEIWYNSRKIEGAIWKRN